MSRTMLPAMLLLLLLLGACGQDATTSSGEAAPEVATSELAEGTQRAPATDRAVTVYTTGSTARLQSVLDAYRAETGARARVLVDESVQSQASPDHPEIPENADLYISDGFAGVWAVAEADELRPSFSTALESDIPAGLRDPESRWFGLSARARIIAYNPANVSATEIAQVQSYATLGDDMWRDRLCLSSSRLAKNRLLVAYLIDHEGLRETEIIVRQWRANFAARIYASDAELLKAISTGECAIGIADNSAIATFLSRSGTASPQLAAHWFAAGNSILVDVRGAGVSRHAVDAEGAVRLLEWLASQEANALFALQEMEFPANVAAVTANMNSAETARVREAGAIASLGFLLEDARKLSERARYP